MTVNQHFFYRTYGVRNINELASPRLFELKQFAFPMRSVLHYVTYDSIESGPASDYTLFSNVDKSIAFKSITEINAYYGSPTLRQDVNVTEVIRDYRNNNRRMKLLNGEISTVVDPNTLVVLNYCLLNKRYKYVRNIFTDYHRWQNILSTVVDTFADNTSNPQVAHYLPLSIPQIIPSVNQLDRAALNLDQTTLKSIKDDSSFVLLELWKWLEPKTTKDSLFSKIPLNKIHLFNLVFIKRSKWCVLNLGLLGSFRALNLTSLKPEDTPVLVSKVKLDFNQIQKRLLKFLMTLEAGSIEVIDEEETTLPAEEQIQIQTDEDGEEIQVAVNKKPKGPTPEELAAKEEKKLQLLTIDDEDEPDVVKEKIKLQDLELDQELDQLNEINQRRESELDTQNNLSIYDLLNEKEPELDKVIIDMCDKLADNNLLTAGEYKRFLKLSSSYKRIVAKDNKNTLGEYVKVDPTELKLEDKQNIPDSEAILDKSMLHASLQDFDSQYVKKDIIGKDTAGMILAMQKAGIIITDYKVQTTESILGGEEMHTVRIVPVEGMPSTLRFKVPLIKEDGTFVSNGVTYRNRKQIGD